MLEKYKENNGVLLSIVIPIYNCEKSLPVLLDSTICIERKDIEIFLVDDGSTDNSLSICQEYAKSDSRISVLHKENGGVSSARNMGIEVAHGEYLTFFDSDDVIVPETLEKMVFFLSRNGVDLATADILYYNNLINQSLVPALDIPQNRVLLRNEIISYFLSPLVLKSGTGLASSCNKLFKRSIIIENNIRFEEKVFKGEDWRFILDYLTYAQTAYYIPEVLYEYRLDGSQKESKYRVATGICALGSVKRKVNLNRDFHLGASEGLVLTWYSQVYEQIIISIKHHCEKTDIMKMLKDPIVKEASDAFGNTKGDVLIGLEIPRKYKLYAKLIHFKMYHSFFVLCRRLEK